MKIVCDSCGAKYSIADEKVQGKVFKIRCKKCSNVIVVKGTAEAEAADSGGAAEWYVVIDGEQVGPVTTVEIDSYFMSGQVTSESYAWKDGMGDWLHLSAIAEFSHLVQETAGPNEATQIADSARYDSYVSNDVDSTNVVSSPLAMSGSGFSADSGFSDPYPSDPSYGEDDYGYDDSGYAGYAGGYDGAGVGGELAAAGPDDGGGMFAAFDSGGDSDFMSFGDAPAPEAVIPTSSIGDGLVGQRNENSVLFSLSSLDSVSAVGPKDEPVTEGSGLIDIQALASAHKSMSSSNDDGPSVDPFAHGTMAMPALMPMGSHRNNTQLYVMVGLGLLVVLVMGGMLVWALTRDTPEPREVIREVHTVEKVVEVAASDQQRVADEAAEAARAAEQAAAAEPKKVEDEPKAPAADKKKSTAPKTAAVAKAPANDPPPVERKTTAKKKDGIDSIIDRIDAAAEAKSSKSSKASSSSQSSGGKDALTRDDVRNTINRYNSRINTCARSQNSANKTGTIEVEFQIRPNGRVHGAQVLSSGFKGTDLGRCVQHVVESMTFPKTNASKDTPVKYPFIIK